MRKLDIWVVVSQQKLVLEVSEELVLGETAIRELNLYTVKSLINNEEITEKVRKLIDEIPNNEDAQMAAWASSNGGLW